MNCSSVVLCWWLALLGHCLFAFGFIDSSSISLTYPSTSRLGRDPITSFAASRSYSHQVNRTRTNSNNVNVPSQQQRKRDASAPPPRLSRSNKNGSFSDSPPKRRHKPLRKQSSHQASSHNDNYNNRSKIWKQVNRIQSSKELEIWIRQQSFDELKIPDQISFVKLLQSKGEFKAILYFLDSLTNKPNVKVCTTAMFAMALSTHHRHEALGILEFMDRKTVAPTSLTFIALLGSIDGPAATTYMMSRFEKYKEAKMNAEVYNSAIYACRRIRSSGANKSLHEQQQRPENINDDDWQVALGLLRRMRNRGIQPTTKTFHALLQVLARSGKVGMATALLQQIKNTPGLEPDDSVWAAFLNVCAQASDHRGAIKIINDMQRDGCRPNLRHCSALIKAFVKSKQDQLALQALEMMIGSSLSSNDIDYEDATAKVQKDCPFRLPRTTPDLVALNTVMAALGKAKNYEAAISIFDRMKAGEFHDPHNKNIVIKPDLITYHHLLNSCSNPVDAREIVKEMRLSRRYRYGAVPPNNVTYVHAVNVCQRATYPDLSLVDTLFGWAEADGIKPSVFMYSSAIWTAQRRDDWKKALLYFQKMDKDGCIANTVVYNGVLSAMCTSNDISRMMGLYREMKIKGHRLSRATIKRLAKSITSMDDVAEKQKYFEEVFDLMTLEERKTRICGPIFGALISIYGSQGRVDKALECFASIDGLVDKQCLRSVLLACALSHPARWDEACQILHTSFIVETAGPGKIDQIALGNAILACSKADEFEEGLNLLQLYGIHQSEREAERTPAIPVVAMNALISACGRGRRPDLSLACFNEMQSKFGVRPDVRSYRSAVIACNQAEHQIRLKKTSHALPLEADEFENPVQWWECALALLRRMREEDLTPDIFIFSSAISACEAAGEWQRALGVLQLILDEYDSEDGDEVSLNLYCFNAAISACEKGGAWIEALELYERMLHRGGSIRPNFVTLSSLIVALETAGQKELALQKYVEGLELGLFDPFRWTSNKAGSRIRALDLHRFSAAMAKVAIRHTLDSYLSNTDNDLTADQDLVIITGRGRNSAYEPILKSTTLDLLWDEYQLEGKQDPTNPGRVIVDSNTLLQFVATNSWVL